MNRILALFFLLSSFACTPEPKEPNPPLDLPPNSPWLHAEVPIPGIAPYEISFELKQSDNAAPRLAVGMVLHQNSFFVSPYSSDHFKGRFNISIEENAHLVLDERFIETPQSVEENDPHPFIQGLINWVRVNTTYEHELVVQSEGDFEVHGMVTFTIEPRCTLEEVPFTIQRKAGQFIIKEGSTITGCYKSLSNLVTTNC